jgi:hypothetical protein
MIVKFKSKIFKSEFKNTEERSFKLEIFIKPMNLWVSVN